MLFVYLCIFLLNVMYKLAMFPSMNVDLKLKMARLIDFVKWQTLRINKFVTFQF